ncbi:DUF4241 domain-containing protein [Streptomyces sp. NPDC007251]|uniref:DUF4241 domain-containing protein n=1 Tax=Streptomyces sp. NPDC007251 TaxID=3154483 RepID=UPI0033ED1B55
MMAGRAIVEVAYGEGWDPGRAAVLGPVSSAVAAARDAAGQPYAVVLRQEGSHGLIVAHVAWERHYLGLWVYDARGRRFLEMDLRRLAEDRLFLAHQRGWAYEDGMPEFAADAGRVTTRLWPDGSGTRIVEPRGDKGGSLHTTADVPEERRWFPVPAFGRWQGLFAVLGFPGADSCELRESPQVHEGETALPNWRAPQGMRPRHLNELFTAGARFTADEAYTVRDPIEAGTLHLPSGRLVARDPMYRACEQDAGFTVPVAPGSYPVQLASAGYTAEHLGRTLVIDEYTAVRVRVSERPAVSWEPALLEGQDERLLRDGEFHGFGVDSGTGCFVDATMAGELGERFRGGRAAGTWKENDHGITIVDDPATGTNLIAYPSGRGDGSYPVWIGRDTDGEVACFVADMLVLHRATPTRTARCAGH